MKLKRDELTAKQKAYIDANVNKMSATEIARSLGITMYYVKSYLAYKGVEALTPKQWNARMKPADDGKFHVDTFKGEYTWIV